MGLGWTVVLVYLVGRWIDSFAERYDSHQDEI
jgi:hypothetical protein